MSLKKKIVLTAINAKWIHPSLALRLLKANLGALEERCEIIEFNLRQPSGEILETLLAAAAETAILGISVSIWNHSATLELLDGLNKTWPAQAKPVIVLGGPEASHLPPDSPVFRYADYVIRGEGETAFRVLCENILQNRLFDHNSSAYHYAELSQIKSAYYLYTDEDINNKLIYAESSRGCPYNCEFCLSSAGSEVREFPPEKFLSEMDELIQRGVKTFKFLDRSFNINIKRSLQIMEFFLEKLNALSSSPDSSAPFTVHFEMVPSVFPDELRVMLARFPPGSLRLEIGIQTLNPEVSARIGRRSDPEKELEALQFLSEKTNAIIHADLIAGLPGEDIASFGSGFDRLWRVLCEDKKTSDAKDKNMAHESRDQICGRIEIQTGILKLLPGALISRHNETFKMRYSAVPPYEALETSAMSEDDLKRIKNFARFWELIVNRKLLPPAKFLNSTGENGVFNDFMILSDSLFSRFGRNWGIDRNELISELRRNCA
ncbi:MAG: B12-binding domain-containing radical SAM protein [Treponema sp.]|jgi:hypothetical protein|nr:B12-binding domain-containing radical SAM protein [Treponema sp.]